jgi:hypothetical protein
MDLFPNITVVPNPCSDLENCWLVLVARIVSLLPGLSGLLYWCGFSFPYSPREPELVWWTISYFYLDNYFVSSWFFSCPVTSFMIHNFLSLFLWNKVWPLLLWHFSQSHIEEGSIPSSLHLECPHDFIMSNCNTASQVHFSIPPWFLVTYFSVSETTWLQLEGS